MLAGLHDEGVPPDEAPDARRYVWLMTLSALLVDGRADAIAVDLELAGWEPLRDPSGMSREQVRDAVLDAVEHIGDERGHRSANRRGRPRSVIVVVEKMVVFMEKHRDGRWHFHVAMKLSDQVSWRVLKNVLRRRARLASHWSTTHVHFWSTVRYGVFSTAKKPVVDEKPLQYTKNGTPMNLYEESQEPFCAKAWKRKREDTEKQVSWKDKKACRFTLVDFTAVVLDEKLKTRAAVENYTKKKGSAGMRHFVRVNHRKIPALIQECEEWDSAEADFAAEQEIDCPDWELFERYAAAGPCACGEGGCKWRRAIDQFFEKNPLIDRERLAACLREIIVNGPKKTTRVPFIVGPTSAGKSTYLNPVDEVFGSKRVIHRPPETSPYGLMQLDQKGMRFVYWDEYYPTEYAHTGCVPVGACLSVFQGKRAEARASQTTHDGNPEVSWSRGAAFTGPKEGLWALKKKAGPGTFEVTQENVRHMQGRVELFEATYEMDKKKFKDIPNCKTTFCSVVLADSTAFAYRAVPMAIPLAAGTEGIAAGSAQIGEGTLQGFEEFAARASIPQEAARRLEAEMLGLGAVHVGELTKCDWEASAVWSTLGVFVRRRILGCAPN